MTSLAGRAATPCRAVAFVAVVVLGVALRLYNPSALWLDEALSVNIAGSSISDLLEALRHDGSPPLYYLLLHAWMGIFGSGDIAVRSLSSLLAVSALPVTYFIGTRINGPTAGRAAVVVAAVNPFLVRYATETRMYALVVLLTLLLVLAAQRAMEHPVGSRLAAVSVAAGLLALTHYWTLFFLAAAAALLACGAFFGSSRFTARRILGALVLGGLLFLPWLGSFLFQVAHTGTPWADRPGFGVLLDTIRTWGGGFSWPAGLLGMLLIAAALLAVWPRRGWVGRRLTVRKLSSDPVVVLGLFACACGAVVLAVMASRTIGAGFAVRYTSAMIGPALVLVGVGLSRLNQPFQSVFLVAVTALGIAGSVGQPLADNRTQARQTATVLANLARPGDLVVYCPDQLGPAVSRLLPGTIDQVQYPSLAAPELIDWVDYATRNAAASPAALGAKLSERARGRIWLVTAARYRTFERQCAQLASVLTKVRGGREQVQFTDPAFEEQQAVIEFPATVR